MEIKRIILLTALAIIIGGLILLPEYTRLQKMREENRRHEERIRHLVLQNRELEKELNLLREDPEYVEKKARDKLGIIREGEYIYSPR